MPNTKSAVRRTKRTQLQASVNRIRKSKYKSAIKEMSAYLAAGDMKKAESFLPKYHSQLMKVAKTGVIDKKTASRKISRITKKYSILQLQEKGPPYIRFWDFEFMLNGLKRESFKNTSFRNFDLKIYKK